MTIDPGGYVPAPGAAPTSYLDGPTPTSVRGLPADDMIWPPRDVQRANALYAKWAAWHSGDPAHLARIYTNTVGYAMDPQFTVRPMRYAGLVQLAQRSFWGAPATPGALRSAKLHVPLAGDIAATSADLLFGEPPALVVPRSANVAGAPSAPGVTPTKASDNPTQQWLDRMMDEGGLGTTLLEGGEVCSSYGDVYLRVGWDKEIADHVLFDVIPPDSAVPEFRSGWLTAVTFWRELGPLGDGKLYRHLERHEAGRVFHALYVSGDDTKLGVRCPLQAHPETAPFATLVNGEGFAETGCTGLAVEYVPNMRPNRRHRGSPLGRSDYDAIEGVLDALDEAWTSWMRDVRLGKARLIVPDIYMEGQGVGKGAAWDAEREVYTQLHALPGAEGLHIEQVQFAIRVAEHDQTCTALAAQAVRGAGYAVQTFGESSDVAATATEVVARERRSFTTRGRKIGYWRPALARFARSALEMQIAQFGTDGLTALVPDIEFPDGVAVDPLAQAQTLQMLEAAQAISIRTKVEMLHADWDDDRIDAEVTAIKEEQAARQPITVQAGAGGDATDPNAAGDGAAAGSPAGTPVPAGPPAAAPGRAANGRAPAQVGAR